MKISPGDQANQSMVDRLIAEGALWSPDLIAAFRATPRHHFLDRVSQFHRKRNVWRDIDTKDAGPEVLRLIYSDRALITRLSSGIGAPVPISSSSQPSLMAQMLEDLKLTSAISVLEIGAGTGYNAALMAHVLGPERVTTVDVDGDIVAAARSHLSRYTDRGIQILHADGRKPIVSDGPFDRIIVTASTPDLEPAWLDELGDRGLLLAPLTVAPGLSYIVRGAVTNGEFHGRLTRAAYFMPLRAEMEAGPAEAMTPSPGGELRTLPAPWAGWFDRRRLRVHWLGFSQALAFYGLLQGMNVHHRVANNGQQAFGISDGEAIAWYGAEDWQVNNDAGRDLGWSIWRAFLDAGGPWPTEFRLRANPTTSPEPGYRHSFERRGPRCYHRWELIEPRDRPMCM